MAKQNKDKDTIDWIDNIYGEELSNEEVQDKLNKEAAERIEKESNKVFDNIEFSNEESEVVVDILEKKQEKFQDNELKEEKEIKPEEKAVIDSVNKYKTTFSDENHFISEEALEDRFVFFLNKEIFSVDKEMVNIDLYLEENEKASKFKILKECFPEYKIFTQQLKDDFTIPSSENEKLYDRYLTSLKNKEEIDPDKLLDSIQNNDFDVNDGQDEKITKKSRKKRKKP